MSVIHPVPVNDPAVSLFRPHDPAGFWSIEVDGTRSADVRWHASQAGGDVQLREPALRALIHGAASALGLSVVEVGTPPPVPSMDAQPSGFVPLFGEAAACPVIVGGGGA